MPQHTSIAKILEKDLVERRLAYLPGRADLLSVHGIPDDVSVAERIQLTGAPGKNVRGDIDIFACHPDRPHEATAIEIKRIGIDAPDFQTLSLPVRRPEP